MLCGLFLIFTVEEQHGINGVCVFMYTEMISFLSLSFLTLLPHETALPESKAHTPPTFYIQKRRTA